MSPVPNSSLEDLEQTTPDLRRERDEALAREAALAEVLQVINSSPGDLAPVFDAMLEKAHALCGIVTGSLQLFDGEYFRAVAVRTASESLARRLLLARPIVRHRDRFAQSDER
jgi:hypothetical protein